MAVAEPQGNVAMSQVVPKSGSQHIPIDQASRVSVYYFFAACLFPLTEFSEHLQKQKIWIHLLLRISFSTHYPPCTDTTLT